MSIPEPPDDPPATSASAGAGGDDGTVGSLPGTIPPESVAALLRSAGVDSADIAEASEHHHLELLALERLVLPDAPHHDIEEVEATTGMSADLIRQLWRSLGLVEPQPGDRIFTDVDVEMLTNIGALLDTGVIDLELTVQMARVIGSSLSRVASAVIDSIDPSEPGNPTVGDEFATSGPLLLPTLQQVMDYVWRRHVQAAARARMTREHAGTDPGHRVVGFADLVGFTYLSQQVSAHELATVVDRFETIAYDTVNRLGGRVVKMIGDEVMFAVDEEQPAVEIALSLAERYRDDDELSDVRVGLASGPVLQREADLYGPVVNLASRIVNLAFPSTVVCSASVREAVGSQEYTWKPIGYRNLKDIGRVPLFVVRRASAPPRSRSDVEEAHARRTERREARVTEIASTRSRRSRRRNEPDGPGGV